MSPLAASDDARSTTLTPEAERPEATRPRGPVHTPSSPSMLVRLEGRQHVLALQRRRFWRELGFATAMLAADALTVAVVFVVLAQLPIPFADAQREFVTFLLPSTPPALLRRVTSLVFCLAATRSYSTSSMGSQSGRIALAIVLGIVLPRWPELWTAAIVARGLLLGGVVVALLRRARGATSRDVGRAPELRSAPARSGAHAPRRRAEADRHLPGRAHRSGAGSAGRLRPRAGLARRPAGGVAQALRGSAPLEVGRDHPRRAVHRRSAAERADRRLGRGLSSVRAAPPAAARDEQPDADPARRGADLAAQQPGAARLAARGEADARPDRRGGGHDPVRAGAGDRRASR